MSLGAASLISFVMALAGRCRSGPQASGSRPADSAGPRGVRDRGSGGLPRQFKSRVTDSNRAIAAARPGTHWQSR
jgi:hypothetical protein